MTSHAFGGFHFIERKRRHQVELEQLLDSHENGARGTITTRSAEDLLPYVLLGHDWAKKRGLLSSTPSASGATKAKPRGSM